jgi:hypothetical protein
MVYASLKALEAGLTYLQPVDDLVRKATKPDPDEPGGLTWRSPKERDAVFDAVAKLAWDRASVQDPQTGRSIPAREFYKTH